ncbi:PTS system ascorbate-specific enzyme IIC/IIB [synthetic Mycoplasma mycoides JCVI-syn1.0]|uniref:PTS ascorbate-specific subunit IIBC n=1 Tax=Mycoplasma mycoides TaxID=2102 RepID=UPI0001793FBB|nr:PTS ascorbate-specific subunit IIBC [Mycoplasma mycoides]ADH22130.1 PTS system ascorbate-specific enzyme IIC/IIB [synthetic Mycoplasma mycoides JCVI-syn1.0]ACU78241.1 PTS system ascorbate-specific enzyme IIC/IIB [Mycoplasma mycoides subsp. capri str. GM12]ACU79071.1 PTS system ascorbate-specific enzyme IIC/IIB [Mycoplasma mycoides subsp. capri str. GM12]SRX61444.1 PTS ascorbate transporter subunit IIC [Mycoplasma mycoides subsp. capri]SRX61610.1 PTS ascorbate transporter subunit IIC [Mycopl
MEFGKYVLNFFTEFISTPAILVALFAFIGSLLQKKKFSECLTSTIKTAIGFLIIGAGAGIIAGSIQKLGFAFNLLFQRSGAIANNDVLPGLFLSISKIVLAGSLIMICAMFLNIVLARISKFKYIYLTGHVLFYFSTMFASVMHVAGLNLDEVKNLTTVVISGALLVSIYMVLTPALLNKHVVKITNNNNLALGHTGSLGYFLSALIGSLIAKISKKKIRYTEDVNFPKGLAFLRNTNVAIGLTMLLLYLIIYFTTFIVHGYEQMVVHKIIENQKDVFVQGLLQALTFAAGVEIVLIGVRMFIAEIVPSFQGISQKIVPNAKPALDCPIVFPYAPNAVLIGFISSFIGGIIAMSITILIVSLKNINVNLWIIIIPSIVPHFFVGATCGVFGNSTGGIKGAIIGSFINGLIISFVPFLFIGLEMIPNIASSKQHIAWGDGDFLLGLPIGILLKLIGSKAGIWVLLLISIISWTILPIYSFLTKKTIFKNIKTNKEQIEIINNNKILTNKYDLKKQYKIVAVCGQGLGSSLLIEMNLKNVVKELDLPIQITHTNLNSFDPNDETILAVVCGIDLQNSIDFKQKIVLENLLDQNEAKQKIIEFLN